MWDGSSYAGICAECFEPVKKGEEYRFKENGRTFHSYCATFKPNNYYVALERIKVSMDKGVDSKDLLKEMELIFNIPNSSDKNYNDDDQEIIDLYKQLSSR